MSDDSNSVFGALLTSGGVIFLGLAFKFGLGFGSRLLIARLLGKVDYGAVSLGVTLMMATSTVVIIGTNNGIGRYLPRYGDVSHRRGILLSAYQIVVPLSLIAGAIVFLLADEIATYAFNEPSIGHIIRVFGLVIPLTTFVRLTVGSIRGMQESLPRVYIQNVALPVVRFGLIAVAIAAGFGSVGIAWAYAGAYGIATALSVYYLVSRTPLFKRVEAVSMHDTLLFFSAPLMITAVMDTVLSNLDTFIIGYFNSTGMVGVYNVAYPLASLLMMFLTAFNFMFMPMMSEFHAEGRYDDIVRTYQVVSKWIFLLTLPVFLVFTFYPELVIRITFGSEYIGGSTVLTILVAGFFFHTIAGPTGNVLMSLGHSRLIMYDTLIVAIVNTVLNLVLIPRYSIVGAAVATTISYALLNGLYLIQFNNKLGAHPFRASLLQPGLAAGALWVVLYAVLSSLLANIFYVFIASITLFVPLYLTIILRFGGIESEELSLLDSFENRLEIDLTSVRSLARRFVK